MHAYIHSSNLLLVNAPIMDYFVFTEYVILELFEHALLLTFVATLRTEFKSTKIISFQFLAPKVRLYLKIPSHKIPSAQYLVSLNPYWVQNPYSQNHYYIKIPSLKISAWYKIPSLEIPTISKSLRSKSSSSKFKKKLSCLSTLHCEKFETA